MPLTKPFIIIIVGPTAIGKTALGVRLAKKIEGEIISCDSMQVYKGVNILSQAPGVKETKNTRYHLIKFLNPQSEFSAAQFAGRAEHLIKDILKRKKIPIVLGGTGLYVRALVDGLFPSPEADQNFRKKMYGLAARYGNEYLYKKLQKVDPQSARLIHKNDIRRVIRALEIYNSTGKTMTELKKSTKGIAGSYKVKIFGLTAPRDLIYSNINDRVDDMINAGALKEVKNIYKKKLSKTANAVIGLRELSGFLKGEYGLNAAKELMKMNTRRFAKRQLTWHRPDKRIKWFDVSKISQGRIISAIAKGVS
ncbi:MAG: tRNA (adenosine(37)-N6)-dimethylallyltransferase MiaA [Candidatus Omnitrophota bacterium]|nr:tRNA (adenosine(37)-N6)-dimethylallyltransferase MiaA [Candidatus Omnitrophota bacterium]